MLREIQASNPILGWTFSIPCSAAHIRLLYIAWRPIYTDLLGFKKFVWFTKCNESASLNGQKLFFVEAKNVHGYGMQKKLNNIL